MLDTTPDLVGYMKNDAPGAHSRTRLDLSPVQVEFTNWRDEQRSWRETAVLFDRSHHMPYGHIVKFDHDFIGREALQKIAESPTRAKVTLVWNSDDVVSIFRSLCEDDIPFKYLELPVADYGSLIQRDAVRAADGSVVGLSTYCGYSGNERKCPSLAMVDLEHATPAPRSQSSGVSRTSDLASPGSRSIARSRCAPRSLGRPTPLRSRPCSGPHWAHPRPHHPFLFDLNQLPQEV